MVLVCSGDRDLFLCGAGETQGESGRPGYAHGVANGAGVSGRGRETDGRRRNGRIAIFAHPAQHVSGGHAGHGSSISDQRGATISGGVIGLHMAMFPYFGAFFLRFFQFFDKIVALSLLPILFIAFGIDELSKIMLIVIGVAPTIILDTVNLTRSVPREQIVKGFTLGAGDFAITYRIVFKQILPRVLNSIRLNLKAVMLFLFAEK